MDYYRFFEQLPKLYENWGQDSIRPKSEKFQAALDRIEGMTTANVMQLLNFAVECMEPDEIYCEVGTYRGSTLIGALLDRPGSMAYAVDNFSEFDVGGENLEKLWENLQKFNLVEQVYFCEQDFEEFFLDLREIETEDKIGVYLYDGAHDYRSQLLGLLLVKPFLADRGLIIVDDANWERVRQANWDFAAANPECKVELDLLTPRRGYPTFLNGIQILSWDVTRSYNYSTATFRYKRQAKVIQELYNLQFPPNDDLVDAYNKLGNLLLKEGKLERAEAIYREAIATNPDRFGSCLNLGNILLQQYRADSAIAAYKTALALSPGNPDVLHNLELAREMQQNPAPYYRELGDTLYREGKYTKAIEEYQKLLKLQPNSADVYEKISNCYGSLYLQEEAIAILQKGVSINPNSAPLHFALITKLLFNGKTLEAINTAENASKHLPDDYTFALLNNLIVPMVYDTPEEIKFYQQRFGQNIERLIDETSLSTDEEIDKAFLGIGRFTNFFLAYQARNVVAEQSIYGNFVHKIMAAKYPELVERLAMPIVEEKIRIGYASNYLHTYSGSLWLKGWITRCNSEQFEIYCYYTGNSPDGMTELLRSKSRSFYHIPGNLEKVAQQIRSDRLHILVFPEIGMDPPTLQLAALRLAPVQCTAWGHPVTSGLPTIDYFISSELMEAANAQEHYSETLIRLPNIGVAYPKPQDIPAKTKTRSDYQLPEDAVIYFCCQAPFKYLPQYDYIFTEIARRVPKAKFLFLRGVILKERLARVFGNANLNSEDYCIHLKIPERYDYLMLNLLSDVFLDTFTWSGGNTSLEAIACNLPIVTCPGEFMRGRHADSFLKMLGVTDTIARDEAEYIDIAVKLGLDREWRERIAKRMSDRHDRLFDDKTCVIALEAFYQQVVREALTS